jgi:hypothetical protein
VYREEAQRRLTMGNQEESCHRSVAPTCALLPTALTDRQSEWRVLTDQALSRKVGPGWISSTYPAKILGKLQALIEAEADCCPFLDFDVRQHGKTVEVELRFPLEFEPVVSAVIT